MPNLLEQLNKGLANRKAVAPTPQQQQIQDVLQAKSGKAAVPSSGPAASSLAENQVISQTNQAAEQLRVQGANAAGAIKEASAQQAEDTRQKTAALDAQQRTFDSGLATQAVNAREEMASREEQVLSSLSADEMRRTDAINNASQNKLKELASQRRISLDNIFAEFEQSNKELRFRKDAAELEQLGFLMSLQDQAYVDEIQAVAKEQNLMDEIAYKEEMLELTLGENFKNTLDQIGFRELFNEQGRINEARLSAIDINAALAMAEASIRDSNNQAIAQGFIDSGKAAADYYGKKEKDKQSTSGLMSDDTSIGPASSTEALS